MGLLKDGDDFSQMASKLCAGNFGALNCLKELYHRANQIDQTLLGGWKHYFHLLDDYGITGSDIYVLHSDICERDILKFMAVLKACDLDLFKIDVLVDACSRQDYSGKEMVHPGMLLLMVREQVPSFGEGVTTAE